MTPGFNRYNKIRCFKFWFVGVVLLCSVANSWASSEKVLYAFQGGSGDGMFPEGALVFDGQGNAYGTTLYGGGGGCPGGCGIVFKLTPTQSGEWTETIIHLFDPNVGDNGQVDSRLTLDEDGNLYGVGSADGSYVFELSPNPNGGAWTETILHQFGSACLSESSAGGCNALGHLLLDSAGNLYGTTTAGGGPKGCGTVYELSPEKNGSWKESVLHVFKQGKSHCASGSTDGQYPDGGLIMDSAGNLYGTTFYGGDDDTGTVFRLTPTGHGKWKETILYTFLAIENPAAGANPYAGLVIDQAGNLYGTTLGGGTTQTQDGVVFELSPTEKGEWTETVIHNFPTPRYVDGEQPYTGVLMDSSGNLYGATYGGGGEAEQNCLDFDGCGTVFKLTAGQGGTWTESILYAFQNFTDGGVLLDDVLSMDTAGNLYGTTQTGGAFPCDKGLVNGCGVAFEVQQ
jgi:uncharacterized repeat protein (TIGR03803 family)